MVDALIELTWDLKFSGQMALPKAKPYEPPQKIIDEPSKSRPQPAQPPKQKPQPA